jgi:hypothetical protein
MMEMTKMTMRCAKNEDERLRQCELSLRWPDGTTVVGLPEELLELLDAICVNERVRAHAGETATEAFADAEVAKVAWLPSGRDGGAHDEGA